MSPKYSFFFFWRLNWNLLNDWNVCFSGTDLVKWKLGLIFPPLPMKKQVVSVWHPNLFITAAIVKPQRILCHPQGRSFVHLYSRSYWSGDCKQIQNSYTFLTRNQPTAVLSVKMLAWNGIWKCPKKWSTYCRNIARDNSRGRVDIYQIPCGI